MYSRKTTQPAGRASGSLVHGLLLVALSLVCTGAAIADDRSDAEPLRFLVASENMRDPYFARTVILMLQHASTGAMGLVVNKASDITLRELFAGRKQMGPRPDLLYLGGPVRRTRIFVLMKGRDAPPGSQEIMPQVHLSAAETALDFALERKWDPTHLRVIAGYAGWGEGQLEGELKRGDWWFHPVSAKLLFDTPPDALWSRLSGRAGSQWAHTQMKTSIHEY